MFALSIYITMYVFCCLSQQEDEEFYNSLTSFKGKPENLKLSDSDSDIDQVCLD